MTPNRGLNASQSMTSEMTALAAHSYDTTVVRMCGWFVPTKRLPAPLYVDQCPALSAKEPRCSVTSCSTECSPRAASGRGKVHRYGAWRATVRKSIRGFFLKSLRKHHECAVPDQPPQEACLEPGAKPSSPPPAAKGSESVGGVAGAMKTDLARGGDRPPDYCAVMLEPQAFGACDRNTIGGELARHDISLDSGRIRVSVTNGNGTKTQQRDTPPDTPNSSTEGADSGDAQPPTPAPQLPIPEGDLSQLRRRLKPFESRSELSPHVARKPMPERKLFGVLTGPFTTPPGGTDPTSASKFPEREPVVTHTEASELVAHNTFSPSLLATITSWKLDALLEHTGVVSALHPSLRVTESRFRILEFEYAFRNSDASVLSNANPFAKLLPPYLPRIVDVTDEDDSLTARSFGTTMAGAGGGGSTGGRAAGGSRVCSRNSDSGSIAPQRGLKRGNNGGDRKDSSKRGRKGPPSDVPGPSGSNGQPSVPCPFRVRGGVDSDRRSCVTNFKNLSKLKEHLRRVHFPHLQCPLLPCTFCAGDKFQITRHISTSHPDQGPLLPILQKVNPEDRRKHVALEARTLTWKQIDQICFWDTNSGAAGGDGGVIPNNEPPNTPGVRASPPIFTSGGPFTDGPSRNPDSKMTYDKGGINMGGYGPKLGPYLDVGGLAGKGLPSPANGLQDEDAVAPAPPPPLPLMSREDFDRIMERYNSLFEEFRKETTQRLFDNLQNRQADANTSQSTVGKLGVLDEIEGLFMELDHTSKHRLKPNSTDGSGFHSQSASELPEDGPWPSFSEDPSYLFPGILGAGMPSHMTGRRSGLFMDTPYAAPEDSFDGEHTANAAPQRPTGDSLPQPPFAGAETVQGMMGDVLAYQVPGGQFTVADNLGWSYMGQNGSPF